MLELRFSLTMLVMVFDPSVAVILQPKPLEYKPKTKI